MMFRIFLLTAFFAPIFSAARAENEEGPEKWETSIADFEARDAAAPPPKGALLFVGSSSIRKWDLESSWPDEPLINNGFGGSTLADSIHYFDRLFTPYTPKAIIIYAGDNDIKKGLNSAGVLRDFETLAALIKGVFPDVPVIYIAIKPSTARWELWPEMKQANDLIAAHCDKDEQLFFADISAPMLKSNEGAPSAKWFVEDGLHLSPFGYREWTSVIDTIIADATETN